MEASRQRKAAALAKAALLADLPATKSPVAVESTTSFPNLATQSGRVAQSSSSTDPASVFSRSSRVSAVGSDDEQLDGMDDDPLMTL